MDTASSVPDDVERYLIESSRSAGQLGGGIGGGAAGARGGSRGAARAARHMSTTVVERVITTSQPDNVVERCRDAFHRTIELSAPDVTARFAVPLGRTGLQVVVVDVVVAPAPGTRSHVTIRTFAKEGWLNRHPARRVADQVVNAVEPGA